MIKSGDHLAEVGFILTPLLNSFQEPATRKSKHYCHSARCEAQQARRNVQRILKGQTSWLPTAVAHISGNAIVKSKAAQKYVGLTRLIGPSKTRQ